MPTLGLGVELTLPEPHQLESEFGSFLQSKSVKLLEVERENILRSTPVGEAVWTSLGEQQYS